MTSSSQPSFTIGDEVYVAPLKSNGIIKAMVGVSRVKVSVGDMLIEVQTRDLCAKKTFTPAVASRTIGQLTTSARERQEASTIDLHGLTVIDALHALEAALSKALLANIRELKVIHGIGSGRVQHAVHEYLKRQPLVASFSADMWNVGVTRVFL